MERGDLGHHRLVDAQASGGVDQHHIMIVIARPQHRSLRDLERLLVGAGRKEIGAGLRGDGLELVDGGRAIDVARDRQHLFLLLLAQPLGELADRSGLAGALQAGHQDDRRRLCGEIELGGRAADQRSELVMDHSHQCLTG